MSYSNNQNILQANRHHCKRKTMKIIREIPVNIIYPISFHRIVHFQQFGPQLAKYSGEHYLYNGLFIMQFFFNKMSLKVTTYYFVHSEAPCTLQLWARVNLSFTPLGCGPSTPHQLHLNGCTDPKCYVKSSSVSSLSLITRVLRTGYK